MGLRAQLVFVLLLLAASLAWAQAENMTLYVFDTGTPVKGIEVLVDGALVGLSDARGVVRLGLEPGIHHLELKREASVVLAQQILTVQDEISQWIVDITGGGSAIFDVESSNAGLLPEVGEKAGSKDQQGSGTIEGRLLSVEDRSPVEGARVYVSGVAEETRSDADGRFSATAPAGEHSISVLHAGYNTLTRDQVVISANETTSLELELTPAGAELPEFVVIAPFVSGSLASVLAERQEADTISDILSAEQISRSGDSDAAGALKRVAGLTLVGDGFVYIRGLGERYSSTLLNGAMVPSPDPTRRVVPLDLFPTDILESVLVQKTYSPSAPADFGGGIIELRTLGMPEDGFFTASAGIEYLAGTTYDDGWSYAGGGRDWTGYDDGARALPDSMCAALCDGTEMRPASPFLPGGFTPAEIEQFGEDLSGVWDIEPKQIGPNGEASAAGGYVWNRGDWSLGFTASGLWDQDWATRVEQRRVYTASTAGLSLVDDLERTNTTRDIALSAYVATELSWKDQHSVTFTYMLLRQSRDLAQAESGINESPDQEVLLRKLQWYENELEIMQLAGAHVVEPLGDLQLEWMLESSSAAREEPNTRYYRYESDNTGQLALSTRAESNSQNFATLGDSNDSWGIHPSKEFKLNPGNTLSVGLGAGEISRDRESSLRRFSFKDIGPLSRDPELRRNLSLEEILNETYIGPDGFQLRETTQATDNYTATLEQQWSYIAFNYAWSDKLQIGLGMRREDHLQRVETFQLFAPDAPPLVGEIDQTDQLPSASLTWGLRPDMQLRLIYAQTLNRPDFRELAAAPYEDPLLDETLIGNPELQQAEINHYDFRWEWYPGDFQSFSLAGFYKEFTKPIEKLIQPGAFNVTTLSNAEGAENYGAEADFLVQLTPLSRAVQNVPLLRKVPFENLYFNGNLAWIHSEIRLRPEDVVTNTNATRPLEGQSPYVVNFQLGYDSADERWTGTLLYNSFGERIVKVGLLGAPDVYQQPVHALDFVLSYQQDEHWNFSFKAKNLLDNTFRFTQGPEETRKYQIGRSFGLTVSYEL